MGGKSYLQIVEVELRDKPDPFVVVREKSSEGPIPITYQVFESGALAIEYYSREFSGELESQVFNKKEWVSLSLQFVPQ